MVGAKLNKQQGIVPSGSMAFFPKRQQGIIPQRKHGIIPKAAWLKPRRQQSCKSPKVDKHRFHEYSKANLAHIVHHVLVVDGHSQDQAQQTVIHFKHHLVELLVGHEDEHAVLIVQEEDKLDLVEVLQGSGHSVQVQSEVDEDLLDSTLS